jgi:hypothetical protein
MRLRPLFLAFLGSITLFTQAQTSADNPLLHHIPADAEKVYHINYSVVSGKLDWQTLGPAAFKKEEDRKYISYLTHPEQLGIDPRPGLIIAQSNLISLDSPRYTTLLFALADSAKFINFLKSDHHPSDGKQVWHSGKPRTATQGKAAFAWDDKIIAITFVKSPLKKSLAKFDPNAHPDEAAPEGRYLSSATRRSVAALKGTATGAIAADPEFRAAMTDDADAHIYTRFGGGLGMMADMMRMTHAPIGNELVAAMDQMKHGHLHSLATIRFDKGLASLRSRLFYDSLTGLDRGFRPINTSLIERLPQGNLLGFVSLHIDPQAYLNLIQRFVGASVIKSIDSMFEKKGLTTKEFLSAFKGDLMIAAVDKGQTIPATDSTPAKPAPPTAWLVLTIADKNAFDKVNTQLHLVRDSAAAAPVTDSAKHKKPLAHTLRDDILVLGPSQQATDEYFNQPGRGQSRLESEEVRSSSFALAIDMKAVSIYLAPMLAGDSPKNQQTKAVLALFDQITATGGRSQGKAMETAFEIRLTDQQTNSLTIISQLLSSMSKH